MIVILGHSFFRLIFSSIIALTTVTLLSGCGALITGGAWLSKDEVKPSSTNVVVIGEARTTPSKEVANKFAAMALFAKLVYRKDLHPDIRREKGCAYLNESKSFDLGMPREADGSGWSRWKGGAPAISCDDIDGLAYETYLHQDRSGKVDEAVIAFRGTENYSTEQLFSDWSTNFAAALGTEPSQFKLAQERVPLIIEQLKLKFPGIKIYATGHSLGGGLAQQAGYISPEILEVFAFNPSPVTNWSFLHLNGKIRVQDPIIYRVYHWHEGLAYVRNVTSRLNSRRFGRTDYEFFFQDEKPVAAHEMGILACHLANIIQGDAADHHYPKSFAMSVISPSYKQQEHFEHPVCPSSVKL